MPTNTDSSYEGELDEILYYFELDSLKDNRKANDDSITTQSYEKRRTINRNDAKSRLYRLMDRVHASSYKKALYDVGYGYDPIKSIEAVEKELSVLRKSEDRES